MSEYDPSNWYWVVAESETNVFSSMSGNYIPISDVTYRAWLDAGNLPTKIGSESDLGDRLAPYNIRPIAANVLDGYQESQAKKLTLEVVAKVLFNVVNELRVLKGQNPVTAQQFKAYVKGLM